MYIYCLFSNYITENNKKHDESVDWVGNDLENLNNSNDYDSVGNDLEIFNDLEQLTDSNLDHLNDSNVETTLEVTADCNESWCKNFIYLFYQTQYGQGGRII